MRQIKTKMQLYEFLMDYRIAHETNEDVIDLIDIIGQSYLADTVNKVGRENVEQRMDRELRRIYEDFSVSVLGLPAHIEGADNKAISKIRQYLYRTVNLKNRENKMLVTEDQVIFQVTLIWKLILRKDNWEALPVFMRMWTRPYQIEPKLSNILNFLRDRMRNTGEGVTLKRQAEQEAYKEAIFAYLSSKE